MKKIVNAMIIGLVAIAIFIAAAFVFILKNKTNMQIDNVDINRVAKAIESEWRREVPSYDITCKYNYKVIDINGNIKFSKLNDKNNSNEYFFHVNDAIKKGYIIVDVAIDGDVLGKIFFDADIYSDIQKIIVNLIITLLIMFFAVLAVYLFVCIFCYKKIVNPFKKLKNFARQVSVGNLDVPLKMEKDNLFGAFTESFDMMRQEIYESRQKETDAIYKKNEIMSTLSHDIKTPIATIKAISELMLEKTQNETEEKKLKTIILKTEQIDNIISEVFNSSLMEMDKLDVRVDEIYSSEIIDALNQVDINQKLNYIGAFPQKLILADKKRLLQVVDNVIFNSYKYAGTKIDVQGYEERGFLCVSIKDYGKSVSSDELDLIFNKFYRGKNAQSVKGSGLGLYSVKYFIEKMGGSVEAKKYGDGFAIILSFKVV